MAEPGEPHGEDDLRSYFAGRLPARVAEIAAARQAARDAGWVGEPLRTFHRLVHSLTGAGATFGFPDVTAAAADLERLLQAALAGAPLAEAAAEALLRRLLALAEGRPGAIAKAPAEPFLAAGGEEGLLYLWSRDRALREVIESRLHPLGYRIVPFASLAALQGEAGRRPPAAILLDGDEADEEERRGLAALGLLQPTPARVFLSARGDLAARLAAVRLGGDAYLIKPLEAGVLAEALDELAGGGAADPYRVLIVEDDAETATAYARTLAAAGMRVAVESDPMAVMAPLSRLHPDLILMDLHMPGCTGPELSAVLRQQSGYVGTPIVYLSTEAGVTEQAAAIGAGGDELLTKPIAPDLLLGTVKARARRGRLLTARIAHDGLTGLLNHSHLKQQIEAEIARAGREGWPVAFAMIDLDRFKSINDDFGHTCGDRMLKSLARLLRQRLRRSDGIGRYGGDELAVLLPHTDGPTAWRVLDEIRDGFSRLRLAAGGREVSATLSCGIAVHPPCATATALVEAADAALYEAKDGGRNRVVLRR